LLALDANLLVSAHRDTAPFHRETRALIDSWEEQGTPFGIFLPTVYAFLRVVTHPRIFSPPTPTG